MAELSIVFAIDPHMASQAENIHYLVLDTKSLPTPCTGFNGILS